MESHDEERTMYKAKTWGITNDIQNNIEVQMERAALNAAFFLTIPGAKMIWQFGELGYDISIDQNGRTGRKPVLWNYYDVPERKMLYDTYSKLIKLRDYYGDVSNNRAYWDMQISSSNWLAGRRIRVDGPNFKMVILGNFNPNGNADINPNFPTAGTWYDLMTGETMNVTNLNATISLASGKFKVLTNIKIDFPAGNIEVIKNKIGLQQTQDNLTIVADDSVITAKIYNIGGLLVKQIQAENIVSITNLPKGCYILNVQTNKENVSLKFIK